MPIFNYQGYDSLTGATKQGKIEAESIRAARLKLRNREKIIASEIKEELSLQETQGGGKIGSRVPLSSIAVLTRQFATLQRAHVPLDECLKALTAQVDHPVLRNTLAAVKDMVSEGQSLADAMQGFPKTFDRLYVNMIRAGESSGNLALVLERLADFQEYQIQTRGRLFSALAYPCIMILASFGIILYLFINVIPSLEKVFLSLKLKLPWYTKALLQSSNFIQNHYLLLGLGLLSAVLLLRLCLHSERGGELWDRWILKWPLIGPLVLRVNISKFTRTLSSLLNSGVPIITSLEITKNILKNRVLAHVLSEAKQAVQEGASLGLSIEKSGLFPPLVSHMIRTGERTGELEKMLQHVADAYDAEVQRKVDAMIALIEPLMIIFMGGIVVGIVAAMIFPMLEIMSQIR